MITANEIKKNDFLKINNKIYKVININTTKPGKGPAYANVEMIDINTLKNHPMRFGTDEKVEKIFVETKKVYYGYEDNGEIFFNNELGEDFSIKKNNDTDQLFFPYLDYINLFFYDNNVLFYECPPHCIIKIIETSSPSNLSGTSGTKNKPAVLENGITMNVPNYLTNHQKIKIDIRDLSYIERVND
jgi:elongation factor P